MSAELKVPVTKINGYKVSPGMYEEMHLPSDEQLREELDRIVDSWTTPEQKKFNAWRRKHTKVCRRCRGYGYRRETPYVRCIPCAGKGWVLKEKQ
jgi:DnaJ-class molecular chaperone